MRKQRGITLIALVITIIVLLILATVSISVIMGDDGILSRARNASEQTEIATEKEQIAMAYSSWKLDNASDDFDSNITASELETKMNNSYGSGTVEVTGNNLLKVEYKKSNRSYIVLANGASVNYDELLENAIGKESIGIAENGTLVDMSNWIVMYDTIYGVEGYRLGYEGTAYDTGYVGDIVDGKIVGEVPMYIYEDFDGIDEDLDIEDFELAISADGAFRYQYDLVYPPVLPSSIISMRETFIDCKKLVEAPVIPDGVLEMYNCFSGCESLLEAPEIPASVTIMWGCFGECKKITKAPKIPAGVTDMSNIFSGCESLLEAPEIPEGVENISGCFSDCTSLTKAPTIPSSVEKMYYAFYKCSSLTGTIKIDANVKVYNDYHSCFENAATNESCELVLTGSSSMLQELAETGSENSNIRVGN